MSVLVLGVILVAGFVSPPTAASAGKDASFLREKGDIIAVAVERVRRAPDDAGRALKAGEERLRLAHENYKVAKSTPPTTLESDVRDLTTAATRVRLERSRGRLPPADPKTEELIRRHWESYRLRVGALLEDVLYKRDSGVPESTLYWQGIKDHEALEADLFQALAYNAPPGERSVEEATAKDRWELLKRLENPARVRGLSACVTAPGEHGLSRAFDIAPFYRAAGILPGLNPLKKGTFQVPPGCRTATRREAGAKLVLRSSQGRGRILIGSEERPLAYDYIVVPPEAPYVLENPGREPLEIEFIAILP